MDAIITDIHGNLEALDAVLGAIHEMRPSRIICLGDLVCYGPDSIECVRRSSEWDVTILGDWDATLLEHNHDEWNPTLNRHIEYVRNEFGESSDADFLYATIRWYKHNYIESRIHFVHGTPRDKREWVFPEDTYTPKKLNRIAEQFDKVCICGHAHINGIYRRQSDLEWEFVQPEPGACYDIGIADKTIVTVGSVGQPRDDDPRASFATLDRNFVTFHRVAYDIEITANKIRANPNIDDLYGERLAFGR
jgi:diadenosine tetraphosphatase ApaH/serine/threonine PP2A family protein phosphatase